MSRIRAEDRTAPATVERFPNLGGVVAVKVDGMSWSFDTGVGKARFVWKWEERHDGPNLGMYQTSGDFTFQVYFKTLEVAVAYAVGFTYGWYAKGVMTDSEGRQQTKIGD